MSPLHANDSSPRKPLRLWPGVAAAVVVVAGLVVVPIAMPDRFMYGMFGGLGAGVAIALWWVLLSRAPWVERLGAVALGIVAVFVMKRIVDPSVAGAGMGMMMPMFSVPVLGVGMVAWALASRRLSTGMRRASMVLSIVLASGAFTLVRTGGITGAGVSDLHWRWTKTPEERLLAQVRNEPFNAAGDKPKTAAPPAAPEIPSPTAAPSAEGAPAPAAPPATQAAKAAETHVAAGEDATAGPPVAAVAMKPADWPGFRGPDRDSIVHGVRIETDWSAKPPVQLWRRPIGPGWSSFAVVGDILYTQEQRGANEIVAAYRVTTGAPLWQHRDATRFYESNGGAGPRGTPTLYNGRVYTVGATGIVNALDARTGAGVWSRNVGTDTHKEVPGWGFASSPLVVDDLAIVAATGTLVAYDVATGKPRWFGPAHRGGYSSPHRATIDGVPQVLLLTADGVTSVSPQDGKMLWEHAWPGVPIIQPAVTAEGDVLLTTGDAMGAIGIRRIAVTHGSNGWTTEERWTSNGLKPYFNDYVVHKGYAFGFDNSILACIDLKDGTRKWKGGRYGHGQLILLRNQDVLLVLSEEGELVLVSATPEKFTEIARAPALEGKTWNHPVLVGDVLLVRNGEEMAAFRLALAKTFAGEHGNP